MSYQLSGTYAETVVSGGTAATKNYENAVGRVVMLDIVSASSDVGALVKFYDKDGAEVGGVPCYMSGDYSKSSINDLVKLTLETAKDNMRQNGMDIVNASDSVNEGMILYEP